MGDELTQYETELLARIVTLEKMNNNLYHELGDMDKVIDEQNKRINAMNETVMALLEMYVDVTQA